MGIIAKQSFYNSISIALAFLIGAINTVYLYPTHMGSKLQGLIVALLALSNLVQPFISFGVQHAVIKFYSSCKNKAEKDKLLSLSIFLPIMVFSLLLTLTFFFNTKIIGFIASENKEIGKYAYLILAVAFSTALFEVFYNWLRIQLFSVFGNFLKEFFPRALIFTLLLIYSFGGLNLEEFIIVLILRHIIYSHYRRFSMNTATPSFLMSITLQHKY